MKKLAILTIALAMIVGSLFAAPKEKKPPVVIFDPATTAVDAGEVVTINGEKYLKIKNGKITLGGTCSVAGLSPDRDGSFEYYMSESISNDDAKGIGPLILSYNELKMLE